MPTYEYQCQSCDFIFEKFQSMKDAPLKKCPKCRAKVKRLLGKGAGILFKGSGFYTTDYRSESYQTAAKKDMKPEAKSEAKSETKLETKSEIKKESKSAEHPKKSNPKDG